MLNGLGIFALQVLVFLTVNGLAEHFFNVGIFLN